MPQYDEFIPWKKYPELTQERLATVAALIRAVRENAAGLHDPKAGDGAWGLGCRAYERMCFAIEKACETHSWLTIVPEKEKPLRFTFAIGHVPFRILSRRAWRPA